MFDEIASKLVMDCGGFLTEYTMYLNIATGEYVFIFGDKDIYTPDNTDPDWVCETREESWIWFENYHGINEEE